MNEIHPYHLLMIDDSTPDIRLMEEAISIVGLDKIVSTYCSNTWPEALDILESNHENGIAFDLVLLDLNLHKINGREILKSIRTNVRFASLPVFILTNSNNRSDVSDCLNLRASAYFEKPIDFNRLVDFFDAVKQSLNLVHRISVSQIQRNYPELKTLE
jgi:CheY-like chemotaxis protein